jgi:hypothetical protein
MIKSRKMRWAGHVARMEEMRNAYKILVWKPEEKVWTAFMWLRIGTVTGCCEYGNEPSCSTKGETSLAQFSVLFSFQG